VIVLIKNRYNGAKMKDESVRKIYFFSIWIRLYSKIDFFEKLYIYKRYDNGTAYKGMEL